MTVTKRHSDFKMEVDVQDGKHKDFFIRKTISLSDAERLLKSGVGIGYTFADGNRSTRNFLGADFITLNIQDGQTPEALINQEDWTRHIGGVVCSSSREAASSRSYLWLIQLPRRIFDADELIWCKRALANYLQLKINTDEVTAIAVVKGAKSALMIGNRAMDAGVLEFLIQDGQREAISDTVANGAHAAATISVARLPVTQRFATATGIELRLDEISKKTSVNCPFHTGAGGTSFVSQLKKMLAKVQDALARVETDRLMERLSPDQYPVVRENISKEKLAIEVEIEQLTAKADGIGRDRRWFKWLDNFRQKIDSFKDFTPAQRKEVLAGLLTSVDVFMIDSQTHWLELQFNVPLVDDELVYRDPSNKKLGYAIKNGMTTCMVELSQKSHSKKKPIEPTT